MKTYDRILKSIADTPWAILPSKIEEIVGVVEARMNGITLNAEEFTAMRQAQESRLGIRQGVGVIGLHGTISAKVGLFEGSGGTSVEAFLKNLDAAVKDQDVASVVVDLDTPGGSVFGIAEGAAAIRKYRGVKPIIGVVNHMAASAGYWLGSQLDELVMSPSALVGSIGVMTTHIDYSAMNEQDGVKVTYIHAGKYKVEGNANEPLSAEAKDAEQAIVDKYYTMFINDVAAGRKVSTTTVLEKFGQGRVVMAEQALAVGMVDRIGTFDQVVQEQLQAASRKRSRRAAVAALAKSYIDK